MPMQGVFVFADDGVEFYRTIPAAAAAVEAIDVRDGVYEAFFTPAGERLVPRILDDVRVHLEPSGEFAAEDLHRLLGRERANRAAFGSDPQDPIAVADELLAGQWSARWPRWPRWLDRRLHGNEPPRAQAD